MNCEEFLLDDTMAVTAIPIADFQPGTSAWQLAPTIPATAFSPAVTNAVTVGRQKARSGNTTAAALVPIRRMTGKAKDNPDDSTAGRLHTVTVTCEVDDRDTANDTGGKNVFDHLLALQRTPSHLLLTFRGGQKAFVQATGDTYLCKVERDGAKTTLTFRVQCLMGLQLIV